MYKSGLSTDTSVELMTGQVRVYMSIACLLLPLISAHLDDVGHSYLPVLRGRFSFFYHLGSHDSCAANDRRLLAYDC